MIVTFLRDLFGGCREAPSDSREAVGEVKNGNKRSDKYDSDVKALKERYRVEFETGVCIKRREVKHLIIRYLTSLFGVGHLGLDLGPPDYESVAKDAEFCKFSTCNRLN